MERTLVHHSLSCPILLKGCNSFSLNQQDLRVQKLLSAVVDTYNHSYSGS